MRLLVLSDLHLELKPRWSLRRRWPDYDVAVVAGDLAGSIALGVAMLATYPVLGGRPAIYVPGNHEYWEDEIGQAEQAGHWVALGTNVHLLQGSSVVINGVRFAGATLWTDYALDGEGCPRRGHSRAGRGGDAPQRRHRRHSVRGAGRGGGGLSQGGGRGQHR